MRARVVVFALAAVAVFASVVARQETAAAQGAEVELTIAGPTADSGALLATVQALLGDREVTLMPSQVDAIDPREVVTPSAGFVPRLARIWVDLGADRSTVYVADGAWERVLVRHVPGAIDEVTREQVAQIVLGSVDALLAGAQIGFEREQVREQLGVEPPEPPSLELPAPEMPVPVFPPGPSRGTAVAAEIEVGYGLQLWADGPALGHLPRIGVAVLVPTDVLRVVATASAALRVPSSKRTELVRLDINGADLRFEGGVALGIREGTEVRLTAGLLLEVTTAEPRMVTGSPVMPRGSETWVAPLLSMRAMVMQRFWRSLRAGAGLALDVELVDTRYVIAFRDFEATVVDPWSLRPSLWLSLSAEL